MYRIRIIMCGVLLLIGVGLSGCAKTPPGVVCPDFGRYCHKMPVNSWDYHGD